VLSICVSDNAHTGVDKLHAVYVLYLIRYQRDREGRTALDWAERFGSAQLADVMRYDPKRVSNLLHHYIYHSTEVRCHT
jgi:hypothetical protein